MNILLDSHALVWLADEDPRLPQRVISIMHHDEHSLFLSVATYWELEIKRQTRRIESRDSVSDLLAQLVIDLSLTFLPILPSHVRAYGNLPLHHRDPFDRMLIAQAQSERMPILTADPRFRPYNIETIW